MNHMAVPLSSLFQIGSSKRVLKFQWKECGVPFYRGREVTRLALNGSVDNELFISEEHYKELAAKSGVPEAGDIIITAIGTIGNSYIVQPNDRFYFKDASILWMKRKSEVSSQFVNLWLKSPLFFEQLDRGNGATVDTLTIQKLQQVKINLPTLFEQQRIVSLLEQAFEGIAAARANTEKNRQNSLTLFESYLHDIFSQQGKGWVVKPLADLCEPARVITYGVIKLGDETPNGVPCLRTSNVRWLNIETQGIKRIAAKLSADYARTILKGGEVLVNVRGTLGGVAVVEPTMTGWNISREVAMVPVDPLQMNPNFLSYLIGSGVSQQWLGGVKKGATYVGINLEDLRLLPVSVPPLDEQMKIVSYLDQRNAETKHLSSLYQRKIDALDELKQSLLHQAFSGQL
ncbi:restriction endonuclease subunit S [Citrobacter sp. RHBSTW-00944]|uniref:restriction endonuclease subunit S n=1 Tax=Citrobacter sp. RHBSTW-00944 TaxID=2742671 RepID=UPI0015E5769C|nr:restriction endonuclease subunit S [Citrobacter sp. RHBSTW-00944]QLO83587.1 restriction endonuclease subunit S [Citrobacter sp. RHBSTW-00944]